MSFALPLLTTSPAHAYDHWVGNLQIQSMFGSAVAAGAATPGHVAFGADRQPAGTCNHWGRYFIFDTSTPQGEMMLTILLTAQASGQRVDLWYTTSPSAGRNHTSGCAIDQLSVVEVIGIH